MIGWLFKKRTAAARQVGAPQVTAVAANCRDPVMVREPALFSQPDSPACAAFLSRVFSVPEIRQVDIDPQQGAAQIHYGAADGLSGGILRQIARALSDRGPADGQASWAGQLFLRQGKPSVVSVVRHGEALTTWQLLHELPGRVRLRHDTLVGDTNAALYVEQELKATFGVLDVKAKSLTGSVLIHFSSEVLRTDQLLRIVEGILHDFHSPRGRGYRHPYAPTALTNTALGLGAIADFAVPALIPASAALLVLTNLKTFREAWRELRSRRPGTNVLYTAIVAATLAAGGFFVAALMGWFMSFWDRRYHRRLSVAQWQLLADFQRQPRSAWISRGGVDIEIPIEELRWGHIVTLRTGDRVPVDGMVTEGQAQVDERLVRGVQGLSPKAKGAKVYAGSLVLDGSLKVKVIRAGQRTRAAAIGRMIEQASTPRPEPLMVRGESFARRTVLPTLATAGAGLAVGDVATALAILRPDYATGPGMAAPLGVLQDLHAALQCGLVVRDPRVFERIRDVDVVLLDSPPASHASANGNGHAGRRHPFAGQDRPALRSVRVGVISEQPDRELQSVAEQLGADFWHGGLRAEQRTELVRQLNEQGKRVAFVGDCQAFPQAAREAHVAISLGDLANHEQDAGQVFALQADLQSLHRLWNISQSGGRRWRAQQGSTLVPNLLCIAGVFFLEFTSLYTVLITNAGVWTVYRQGTSWLRGLERRPRPNGASAHVSAEPSKGSDVQNSILAEREPATWNGTARPKSNSVRLSPVDGVPVTEM